MDDLIAEYHPSVQAVIIKKFRTDDQSNRKFISSLLTGRAVSTYTKTKTDNIIANAILTNGMFLHHDQPLSQCVQKHTERWQSVSQPVSDITKTFFCELSKRCLSVAEIVVAMLLLKSRYFTTDAKEKSKIIESVKKLTLPHYNTSLSWQAVFTAIDTYGAARQKVICPEMSRIFTDSWRAIIAVLRRDAMCFEGSVDMLKRLRNDEVLTDSMAKRLCFGGITTKAIAPTDSSLRKVLEYYQEFENGNFDQLTSLLLTVQLTIRVNLLLIYNPDFTSLNAKERELQFANVTLYRIVAVLENNPLAELFAYPASFLGKLGSQRLLDCELLINSVPVRTVLETEVLYYLFGEKQHQLFCDALTEDVASKKILFLQEAQHSKTVTYNGVVMPVAWSKMRQFKNVQA